MTRFVLAAALVCLCGSAGLAEDPQTREVDVLAGLGLPGMIRTHIVNNLRQGLMQLPVELALRDGDREPAAHVDVKLKWKDGVKDIRTDDAGKASFALTGAMMPRVVLLIPRTHRATLTTPSIRVGTSTGSGWPGGGAEPTTLDLAELELLEVKGVEVYYPKGQERVAQEVLAYLERARGFVRGFVGLRLDTPYGVALHDVAGGNMRILGRSVFPVSISSWKSGNSLLGVRWVQVHEWVETSVAGPIYMNDKRTRFVGDGLAEILSYEYCKRFAPADIPGRLRQYLQRADALLAAGTDQYELAKLFHARVATQTGGAQPDPDDGGFRFRPSPEEAAGYPMSFFFWHDVLERAGPAALRDVIKWLTSDGDNPDRTAEGVLARIERAAGFRPSGVIDVKKARETFRKMLAEAERDE